MICKNYVINMYSFKIFKLYTCLYYTYKHYVLHIIYMRACVYTYTSIYW